MPSIRFTFFSKFNEIKVPLPHKLRVFHEKSSCKNLSRVSDASIALFPEPVVTSEGWDSTGCTQTSSSDYHDMLLSHHVLRCFLWCALNRLVYVLLWCILHSFLHISDNCNPNIGAYLLELSDFVSETLQVN